MSTSDYFKKGAAKTTPSNTQDGAFDLEGTEVESAEHASQRSIQKNRFIPDVDYTTASNFAKFGSAEEYYRSSFKRVYLQYPYDGSKAEKVKFENESSYFDKYLFDEVYPRATGHVIFSPTGWGTLSGPGAALTGGYGLSDSLEYIKVIGGPHTASGGLSGKSLSTAFGETTYRTSPGSNYYDTDIYDTDGIKSSGRKGTRESNLRFDLSKGVSTEFWLKKGSWITDLTQKEVVYDLWNAQPSSSAGYGRLLVTLSGTTHGQSPFRVHLASGSSVWDMSFGGLTTTTASLTDTWKHVAFTFASSSVNKRLETKFYINGDLQETQTNTTTPFGQVTGSLIGYLGALQTTPSGSAFAGKSMAGYGKLSGSIDEFRFWKTKRTSKDIGRNWFTQVAGGSNTDVSNTELGVYFKFNEGITGTSSVDSRVLDYSGRISNGNWVGYQAAARSTTSAMVQASASADEFKDPILHSKHADIQTQLNKFVASGSAWDEQNNSLLYHSFPSFMLEEEENNGGAQHLKQLTQIMGSYFDTLSLQIESLPSLVSSNFQSGSNRPSPFSQRQLNSKGFIAPEIFADVDVLGFVANRNEEMDFELDLSDVKSHIYQNIYNSLVTIYKSKGTEQAFRNLIRCYGVDEELIKLNLYTRGATQTLRENYKPKTVKKNFVDFSRSDNFDSTVYQHSASRNSNTTSVTYISGTDKHLANTAEIEVFFPKEITATDGNQSYVPTPFITSSIFGHHVAATKPTDFRWPAAASDFNFEVYAIRPEVGDSDAYFMIKDRAGSFYMTSSVYGDVYDNQRWNFSVRLKNSKHPMGNSITGSHTAKPMETASLEFKGYNAISDIVINEFSLTAANLTSSYLTSNRRYYVGAHLTNYTGAVNQRSDVRVTSLRHWASHLDNATLRAHALDSENYGSSNPMRSAYMNQSALDGTHVPQAETLALNWDFSTVSSSNAAGEFTVDDFSSGSIALRGRYPGTFGKIVGNQYAGRGHGFPAAATGVIMPDYVASARQQLPESLGGSDMVSVLSRTDTYASRYRDHRPDSYYFTFEKNFYQTISEEMLNMFGTIVEYNNLIGRPIHKYRESYKGLDKLRNLFFERVRNTPDIDKYLEYYQWIDSSLSEMLQQLVPATADVSEGILNVVESHMLERNKYRAKYKVVEKVQSTEGSVKGYQEQNYSWRLGHAPKTQLIRAATATITVTDAGQMTTNNQCTLITTGGDTVTITGHADTNAMGDTTGASTNGTFAAGNTLSGGSTNNNTQAAAIAATINLHDDFTATAASAVVTIKQNTLGSAGNTSITTTKNGGDGDPEDSVTIVNFTGGKGATPPQNENSLWWKERAERSGPDLTSGNTAIDIDRETLRKRAVYHVSSSSPNHVSLNPGIYKGSKYIVRSLPKLYNFSARVESAIKNGRASFIRHNKDYYKSRIDFGATTGLVLTDVQAEKDISDVIDKPKEIDRKRKRFTAGTDRNERFAPFSIFSSSVPSGYASKFNASNFMAGVDITNNHEDKVMFSEDTPMQGPFSERFVGGSAHRHADLNRGSDSATDRIEAYDLDFAAGKITVRHQDVHQPRSSLYREETAKRPVTFKNIRQSTTSVTNEVSGTIHAPVGNFSKTYEIVMAGDRATNNSSFVKAEGFGSSSTVSKFVSSLNDYASPVRQTVGHTIATRFSAPGGPETSAQCFLDLESGQYSPYNDLNTRNLSVRKPLRELLSEKVERFGIRSGSSVATGYNAAAAFHKTNRNPLKRRELVNSTTVTSISSTFDNYFVQHHIPRSDTQYAWISASYESAYVFGHAHPDGMFSGTMGVGMVPSILFVTASNIAYGGLPVDHVGLNQLIYEPVSSSDARVGYPHGISSDNYRNTAAISVNSAFILNSILLHRRGIYGNPSWSQIANESKPLVREWRRSNTLAFNTTPGEDVVIKKSSASSSFSVKQNRFSALKIFTEPPVTSRNYPLKFVLDVKTKQGDKTARINSVLGNEVDNFTNYPLNRELDMPEKDGVAYNKIKDLYLNGALGSSSSPVEGFRSLTYKQTVFPKAQNSFLAKTRSRPGYRNNFWKTSRTDRDSLGGSKFGATKSTTGGGLLVSILSGAYSSWNMDADTNVITVITGTTAGILQNNKTFFHNGTKTAITASIKFHNAHDVDSTGSVRTRTGMPVPETGTLDQVDLIPGYRLGKMLIGGGNALWEVGDQAGYYDLDGTWVSSPSYPWDDSYDDYVSNIRAHNKDFSIVPEFRISEHINKYVANSDENFLTNNASFLSIAGATSSHPQNSSEDDFYKVYSNSDFMQQFDIIREDHRGFVNPAEVKLTCKAIKKFVPYSGFYPSELLVDLYSQFSSSYGRNVSYSGADLAKSNARIRPFIMPMFAPGIWCNMVKSGIAVDWPVYTGSYGVLQPWGGSHISSYHLIGTASSPGSVGAGGVTDSKAANWDLRVPFEAIIKPEDYLSKISLVDMVPHPSASMNITASWSGDGNKLYKMKAHNALASMIEFFLPGENNKGELSTIVSSPEKDWKPFVSGTAYGMRVKLKKSYNKDRQLFQAATGSYLANAGLAFPTPHDTRIDIQNGLRQTLTICSRPSSFGPAVHGRRGIYQGGRRHTAFSASLDSLTELIRHLLPLIMMAWLGVILFMFTLTMSSQP